jgi:hypothetical protein
MYGLRPAVVQMGEVLYGDPVYVDDILHLSNDQRRQWKLKDFYNWNQMELEEFWDIWANVSISFQALKGM